MSCAPDHSTSLPRLARFSLPSTMVRKWLPASWPTLLAKRTAAVAEQDLGLADPAWIQQDLPGSGIAGVIFRRQPKVEIAERDPAGLAAPADVDDALAIRQQGAEFGTRARRVGVLEAGGEAVGAGGDADVGHVGWFRSALGFVAGVRSKVSRDGTSSTAIRQRIFRSSGRLLQFGTADDLAAEVRAQVLCRAQIDAPSAPQQ